jgi:ribonucleotide reductase beta subunit family protein with ferritin-like domain
MDFNFKTKLEEKNVVNQMTVFNSQEVDTKKQPMFFGAPLGIQRYDTYKYPIFDKLTQQQLGYFWRPEEISLQKDRGDYQTLRPEQKHIFTSNLKYQIMLDSVQGRGPGMAFAPYCSLPELEACMKVWEFMEMIHSRSYTYIIKNVYSDPSDVFDTILSDERIMERAASVTEAYNDLSIVLNIMELLNFGNTPKNQFLTHRQKDMNSNVNCSEQLQTLIFLKVFAFTSVSLAVLHLANSNLWKEVQKSSV